MDSKTNSFENKPPLSGTMHGFQVISEMKLMQAFLKKGFPNGLEMSFDARCDI